MSRTIDRVLYNSVETSSCGHSPYPRNFYSLAPPSPRNFHWSSMVGGRYGYFLESHISKPAALDIIMRGYNGLIALHYYRPKQQEILETCIYKCGYVLHALSRFEMNIDDTRSIGLFSLPCNNWCLHFEVCFPAFMTFGSEERFWYFQIHSEITATICSLFILIIFSRPEGKPFVSSLCSLSNP